MTTTDVSDEDVRTFRIDRGENANGNSMGVFVYSVDPTRPDVLIWGHVGSEGPLDPVTASLLDAIEMWQPSGHIGSDAR